jgi:hypothetical protein
MLRRNPTLLGRRARSAQANYLQLDLSNNISALGRLASKQILGRRVVQFV